MSQLSIVMQAMFFLLTLAVSVLGKPLAFRPRDAISPPITNPTASSVWKAGDRQTVIWDLSGLNGAQPSNPIGQILLGTFINGEEHLMVESPIASGFNILDGNVTLTVPTVTTGSDYIVCHPAPEPQKLTPFSLLPPPTPSAPAVFGSSGDISAPFTIIGTDASASASASTQLNAASSSNTLPPHETTDPSTTISLPHGVPVTGDSSSSAAATTASASTTAVVSVPSGVVSSSGTPVASSTATAPGASSTGTGTNTGTSSGTGTATAAASIGTGNSGMRMAAGNVPLWSAAVSGALALFALL
ncbi:hypothetical protein GSI_15501 [Ganoderma sinense ZZ0214-1]|uniref:Transporter n=1 Tax=Ganoderma sinense ZZ0214-1 TaxID=1077348 RepID=A0A2G8RMR8_9APHY|nr:hypothetical protein GSI_15501 [Ganoderma sinense ZZ0214-1]